MTNYNPLILNQLQTLIAEQIGGDQASLAPDAHLEDDLGLLDPDLVLMLKRLNSQFELNMSLRDLEDNNVFTIGDLTQLIDDELQFA